MTIATSLITATLQILSTCRYVHNAPCLSGSAMICFRCEGHCPLQQCETLAQAQQRHDRRRACSSSSFCKACTRAIAASACTLGRHPQHLCLPCCASLCLRRDSESALFSWPRPAGRSSSGRSAPVEPGQPDRPQPCREPVQIFLTPWCSRPAAEAMVGQDTNACSTNAFTNERLLRGKADASTEWTPDVAHTMLTAPSSTAA